MLTWNSGYTKNRSEPRDNNDEKNKKIFYITAGLLVLAGLLLLIINLITKASSSRNNQSTPTLSVGEIQTQAVWIFSSGLTQTALALPTMTPTLTPTLTPTATNTQPAPSATSTSAFPISACYSLAFLSDITIPDNTNMQPGQLFTKTWQVSNIGTCAWDAGFILKFTTGNSLGSAPLVLTKTVSPGETTELSIQMTAPSLPGSYQGNWRLSNADGSFFGDELYVIIIVPGNNTTKTSTPSPGSATPTLSATPVPTDD